MQKFSYGQSARRRRHTLGAAALIALLAAGSAAASGAGASAPARAGARVTVRVEGAKATLLPAITVSTTNTPVTRDGKRADSCPGASALGALQTATYGNWNGTWSKSYHEYFVTSIEGTDYPSSGVWYWSFWLNDKPESSGACDVTVKSGDSLLFFPGCYGKGCPKVAPAVLGVAAPRAVAAGKAFTVTVTQYANANGKAGPARGVTVTGGGATASTNAAGKATLTLRKAGAVTLDVSAPHTIRTEATVVVRGARA
jgi:hypothetical protein